MMPVRGERPSPTHRGSRASTHYYLFSPGAEVDDMEELDQLELKNPFALPSDEEVFRMRDEERRRKLRVKEQTQELKVWEKTTTCATMGQTKRFKDHEMMKRSHDSKQGKYTRGLVAAATAAISNDRRREKENMADFITKKREMFLVQMSLDTKREEIRKLEEKAQMKEEALKKSELMLEELSNHSTAAIPQEFSLTHLLATLT